MAEGAIRATVYDDTIVFVFCQEKIQVRTWAYAGCPVLCSGEVRESGIAFVYAERRMGKGSAKYSIEKRRIVHFNSALFLRMIAI